MDIDNDDGSSSEMGEEELENMVRQAEQKGTAPRQTKWALKKFEDWIDELKCMSFFLHRCHKKLDGMVTNIYAKSCV